MNIISSVFSILRRVDVAHVAFPAGLSVLALGCAVDAPLDRPDPGENLGQTTQAVSGWMPFGWGTTNDLYGLDTEVVNTNWNCVLSGVAGDLSKGRGWGAISVNSAAKIERSGTFSANTFHILAHGGAYENQNGQRVWANNPVFASTTCIPYPQTDSASWRSTADSVAPPVKISGLVTNRECFLTGITGGEHLWNDSEKFGRVRKITTPDATHPTSGWYVEGNERSDVDGGHAYVTASCVDFPSLALLWDTPKEAPAGGAAVTVPITTGGGVKACGLRTIRGAFNKNSWTDGVRITPPSSATGTWNMTVSAGKFGRAVCVL